MKILVCMKQTFDTEAKIAFDGGKIDSKGVTMIMNPYDEFAVEEALRIKEAGDGEVTVISAGGAKAQDALRQALAMGADNAVLVETDEMEMD
ncbi:MAG: electron transfer flavoprotein subunit beta, partial [Firmicutes bacterium]|nr:electron transfer flavoprotein subunit beta [Bacillota bacterium]